jgi:DNA-binding SARP family transcriptional activator
VPATEKPSVPALRVTLLGGFRVHRDDVPQPIAKWQRRSAKTLIKILATSPGHALHREQVLEILWPGAGLDSALNSFGKTLHAARRAFQPGLLPRERSLYVDMADSMVGLNDDHVLVDADHFEQIAHGALSHPEIGAFERALAAYRGDLLPEDRYADWCAERRELLGDLRLRLLLELADLLEGRGAYNECANRLRAALQHEPTREEIHRRLMRLYTRMGTPDQAVRQFHACEEVLQRELNFAPQKETVAVYHDVLAHRTPERARATHVSELVVSEHGSRANAALPDPFVGRADILGELSSQLAGPPDRGGIVVLSGEPGIGKTRLLEEFAQRATDRGAVVLWGGAGAHAKRFAYGPFAIALERYIRDRPDGERRELARRYPALRGFLPSLVSEGHTDRDAHGEAHNGDVVRAMVRLLSDLALRQPVLVVLGDLHEADDRSLDIIYYLAHLALGRPWLLMAAVRDEDVKPGTAIARLMGSSTRAGLCRRIEVPPLTPAECYELVAALGPRGPVRGERVDQIYSLARGNPLFIRELVEDMRWQPRVDGAEANGVMGAMKGSAVPGRVRVLTEARLAALDTPVQRVLFLAAVAGGAEIPLTELRAGAAALEPPVSGEALFDALDRALELRLLEERISGYAFRHPLMRRAIYERLSRHRRAQFGNALHQSRPARHQSRPARDPSPPRWKHDRNGAGTPRQNES